MMLKILFLKPTNYFGHKLSIQSLAILKNARKTVFQFLPFYFQLILLMLQSKAKFYQFTPQEKDAQQINSIYKMIFNQEKTMNQILTKYNSGNNQDKDEPKPRESKTLDLKHDKSLSASKNIEKSRRKINSGDLDLPAIVSNNSALHIKRKKQRLPQFKQSPYFSQLRNSKDTLKMKQILEKAYLTDKVQKIERTKSKFTIEKSNKKNQSQITISNMTTLPRNQEKKVDLNTQKRKQEKEIPQPMSYVKPIQGEEDEVSSNEGDVPLSYYQRQFKGAVRSQCLEQTNFLYFSKNQSMKDWTENLLLMFQKHDKQLALLKKRCKYLQRFDNNFFSIDIFRND